MLIKCHDGRVFNSKYIRTYAVERAEVARCYSNGNAITTHHAAPESGFVLVAWLTGKAFLTDGLTAVEAHRVLDSLLQAFNDKARVFDVGGGH